MRVLRGRVDDQVADREATTEMVARTAETGEPALRVWRPPRQLAFGRRDTRAEGYHRARDTAAEQGFPPTERSTGGRAVAYAESTVAVAQALPVDDIRTGIADRYEVTKETLQRTFWRLSVPAQRGEPPNSFCAGDHSLQFRGKIAGVAQHISKNAALVGAIVLVRDHEVIAGVLEPVYAALDVAFDPESVGSLERAGGRAEPDAVVEALEAAFVGDREPSVETIG